MKSFKEFLENKKMLKEEKNPAQRGKFSSTAYSIKNKEITVSTSKIDTLKNRKLKDDEEFGNVIQQYSNIKVPRGFFDKTYNGRNIYIDFTDLGNAEVYELIQKPKEVPCPKCNGDGMILNKYEDDYDECPDCHGSGKTTIQANDKISLFKFIPTASDVVALMIRFLNLPGIDTKFLKTLNDNDNLREHTNEPGGWEGKMRIFSEGAPKISVSSLPKTGMLIPNGPFSRNVNNSLGNENEGVSSDALNNCAHFNEKVCFADKQINEFPNYKELRNILIPLWSKNQFGKILICSNEMEKKGRGFETSKLPIKDLLTSEGIVVRLKFQFQDIDGYPGIKRKHPLLPGQYPKIYSAFFYSIGEVVEVYNSKSIQTIPGDILEIALQNQEKGLCGLSHREEVKSNVERNRRMSGSR